MRKMGMLLLTDEAIKSCNNQRFCHIFKKRFCDVDDSDDDNDDDSNGDSNNEKFGVRKFHGDVSGLDDADDDYHGHDYGDK